MQDTLNALIAHKQRFDDGHYSVDQFRSGVEDVVRDTIDQIGAAPVADQQQLLTVTALLEECLSSEWLTDEQYARLKGKLNALSGDTQKQPEAAAREPSTENNGWQRSAYSPPPQEKARREAGSYRNLGRNSSMGPEDEELSSAKKRMEKERGGSMGSTIRQRSMATPLAQWLQWKNLPLSQNDATMNGTAVELVIPKREIIRSARWVSACTLLALFGLFGFSCYVLVPNLIKRKATWQWVVLVLLPILFAFFGFAVKVVFGTIFAMFFSSVRALDKNSEFHSSISTPIMPGRTMPPVIVQIPVYKEDLEEVIMPTYYSVKKAMDYYKARGGKVKIMINDDGLQLLNDEQFGERMHFYRRRNISFCARPPANRRGLFKKASNMNYTFKVIERVHGKMKEKGMPMRDALTEVWTDMNSEFVAGGDITIPDETIILLLDADTRMPEDAIFITMGEFIENPDLPYTQHFTMPFDDQCRNYWEQTISSFTKKIYTVGIASGTSTGDFPPLVGHNAFLRWSAIKGAAFYDPGDHGELKYWSETHVSEDFDMFMRLASGKKYGRYVTYTGNGFQEGVSLTYIDECIKLRKFAYGACEMVFNKFPGWIFHGPFSPIIIKFVGSRHIKWYQKVSLLCYLATYFALASGPFLALFEATMNIFEPEYFAKYSVYGFDVMLTCTIIFSGMATMSEILVNWRLSSLKGGSIFTMIWDSIKFVPTITLLFTGVQFSLCTASFAYFFNRKVVWGATSKETQDITCWEAIRETWKMFWLQYVLCVPLGGAFVYGMIYFTGGLDIVRGWGPLSFVGLHVCAPIILNPYIMSCSF